MTDRVRVLMVSPCFAPAEGYGGLTTAVQTQCESLRAEGAEVRVVTTNADGPEDRLPSGTIMWRSAQGPMAIEYCRRWGMDAFAPGLVAALAPAVRWADVVHLHAVYSFTTFPCLLACRALGRPLVWSSHGSFQSLSDERLPAAKRLWRLACRVTRPAALSLHAASEKEAAACREQGFRAEIFVLPHPVAVPDSPPLFSPSAPDERLKLLFLGRLHPDKGVDALIDAVRLLKERQGPETSLTIAGSSHDDYGAFLRSRVSALGLDERVRFVGEVSGVSRERAYREADVVVVPSKSESFGLVVAEALAHARPVIVSQGAPWSIVNEIDCGLWVPNDSESLALSIARIRSLPLEEMGIRGLKHVKAHLSPSVIARRWIEHYARLRR